MPAYLSYNDELLYSLCYMEGIIYHYNISFILIFYMWLYINVYTPALMVMWVMRFGIITPADLFPATMCIAVRHLLPFWVRASTLLPSGRQLRSSFIAYNTWTQLYHYNISFILIFYTWLHIKVYTHATMIIWVIRFSIITSGEPFSATMCTAVRPSLPFWVRASTYGYGGTDKKIKRSVNRIPGSPVTELVIEFRTSFMPFLRHIQHLSMVPGIPLL